MTETSPDRFPANVLASILRLGRLSAGRAAVAAVAKQNQTALGLCVAGDGAGIARNMNADSHRDLSASGKCSAQSRGVTIWRIIFSVADLIFIGGTRHRHRRNLAAKYDCRSCHRNGRSRARAAKEIARRKNYRCGFSKRCWRLRDAKVFAKPSWLMRCICRSAMAHSTVSRSRLACAICRTGRQHCGRCAASFVQTATC